MIEQSFDKTAGAIRSPKPSWSKSLELRGPEEDNLDNAHTDA
jgi:hypothetical protein